MDFLNVRTDESLSIAVSFLKNRFSTRQVLCSAEPVFDESFLFEFSGENDNMKFDAATMLKLSQPVHLTILKHRKNEKAQVIGTKLVDWRSLLFCNQVEINSEILPISMQQKGSLGVLTLHLDLCPALSQTELLNEESVNKQISLETRFEQESIQKFLDYANDWWSDYKQIKPQFKSRLVKIFAETDDREASIYKPVCSLLAPMMADRLLDSPLHAARFVSLIPFQRVDAPGAEKVEVWHSMQAFLARVSIFAVLPWFKFLGLR